MEWLVILNAFFAVWNGYLAFDCFKDQNTKFGWLNVFASATNAAIVASHIF
jgi:hypothetical protein